MRKYFLILFSSVFFLIQGCSFLMSRTVAVDSYAAVNTAGGSYYLQYEDGPFQLQNMEFTSQIAETLNNLGYTRVFSPSEANYQIRFNSLMKGPFQGSEPYLVQPNPWWEMDGFGYMEGPFYYSSAWSEGIAYYTYYVQELFISALSKSGTPLWQVQGSIKTDTSDPRENFPYLLKAVSQYMDRNSNEVVYVTVTPNEIR